MFRRYLTDQLLVYGRKIFFPNTRKKEMIDRLFL